MLLYALNPDNPYSYYVVMRVIVCAAYAYLCVKAISVKANNWAWILGVQAFVYNPIIPLNLDRETWSVINIVTILVTACNIYSKKKITM